MGNRISLVFFGWFTGFVLLFAFHAHAGETKKHNYGMVTNHNTYTVYLHLLDAEGKKTGIYRSLPPGRSIVVTKGTGGVLVSPTASYPLNTKERLNITMSQADRNGKDPIVVKKIKGFGDKWGFSEPTGGFPPEAFHDEYENHVMDGASLESERDELGARMLRHKDIGVREQAVHMLEKSGSDKAIAALSEAGKDDSINVRDSAYRSLGRIGSDKAADALIGLMEEGHSSLIGGPARSLAKIGGEKAKGALAKALENKDSITRINAAEALGGFSDESSVNSLIKALDDENPNVSKAAIQSLGQIGGEKAMDAVAGKVESQNSWVRFEAAKELASRGDKRGVPALVETVKGLKDDHDILDHVVNSALWALGQSGDESAVPTLVEALGSENEGIRKTAMMSLGQIENNEALDKLQQIAATDEGGMGQMAERVLKRAKERAQAIKQKKQDPYLKKLNQEHMENIKRLDEIDPDSEEARARRRKLLNDTKELDRLVEEQKRIHGDDWKELYRDKEGKLPGGVIEDAGSKSIKLQKSEAEQEKKVSLLRRKADRLRDETRDYKERFEDYLNKKQNEYQRKFYEEHGDSLGWSKEERKAYEKGFEEVSNQARSEWEGEKKKLRELGKTIREIVEAEMRSKELKQRSSEPELEKEALAEVERPKGGIARDEDEREQAREKGALSVLDGTWRGNDFTWADVTIKNGKGTSSYGHFVVQRKKLVVYYGYKPFSMSRHKGDRKYSHEYEFSGTWHQSSGNWSGTIGLHLHTDRVLHVVCEVPPGDVWENPSWLRK